MRNISDEKWTLKKAFTKEETKSLVINAIVFTVLVLASIYLGFHFYDSGFKKGYRKGIKDTADLVKKIELQTEHDIKAI